MRHFCTLADIKYLPQALVLCDSLRKHANEDMRVYFLALDDKCEHALRGLGLDFVNIVSLSDLVREMKLEEIQNRRTKKEWCWTLASQLCEYLMESGLYEITYIDADCQAHSDLRVAFEEIGDRPIAITLHRLIPSKKHLEVNGRYNVGFLTFRNTWTGHACLSKWARQVRARCSESVGCGDQWYLEEFVADHGNLVCVFKNIGINAAPWNIGNWRVTAGPRVDGIPIVTYHYHETRFRDDGSVFLTNYKLRDEDRRFIYDPYTSAICAARDRINLVRHSEHSGHIEVLA